MDIQGLACPSCGGTVHLSEGTRITTCTACGSALLAQGDLGHPSYSVRLEAERPAVLASLSAWWGEMNKARDLAATARVKEAFPVFVPVWRVTGKVVGWVLGELKREENKRTIWIPVERRVSVGCDVNRAACDLGDLGIQSVALASDVLDPFDDDALAKQGMIFRPLTPASEVRAFAVERFLDRGRVAAGVDRMTRAFLHVVGVALALVYYPLWVVRYEYRQRIYQATADGVTGKLLFGRAPGNDVYRVVCFLVGVGGGNLLLTSVLRGLAFDDAAPYLITAVASVGMMYWGYRRFRYGAEVTIGGEESLVAATEQFVSKVSKTTGVKRP
jgi:hypothetical protein